MNSVLDPVIPDWAHLELPDAWPDRLRLWHPLDVARLLRRVFSRRVTLVQLPAGMPGVERIPKYSLVEFHNLPNGNYSKRFTRGYITGFDRVMLGYVRRSHERIARRLAGCSSVLDIGCGGGGLAATLRRQGIAEVWGLDTSPYLLQHAAAANPGIAFVQGAAEHTGFAPQRFDAVTICFLFHEMPGRHIRDCLTEFHRILKPGGLLQIIEPSPTQLRYSAAALWRAWGWQGWYFAVLARVLREPFVTAWHREDVRTLLAAHGFELIAEDDTMPVRHLEARRI